jgi:23S rRNA pseudoU1915 N3-methylase RlmH
LRDRPTGAKVLTAGRSEEEDERIQAAVEKAEGKVVLLDERGREMDSTQFAGWLGLHRDRGQTVTFVIGGGNRTNAKDVRYTDHNLL